mmetsp:Transcript_32754/g.31984  ORF Transcript_32754/g.31984 Transcript_32754/m.31984 type:complete len:144 (+) Transcript_32754:532-963(+)
MGFLESLTTDPANFTNHIKEFEEFFFNIKAVPVFTNDNIKRLYKGDSMKIKGLMNLVAELDGTSLAGVNVIKLLSKILNINKNSNANLFIELLCCYDTKLFLEMRIDKFLEKEQTEQYAFFILEVVLAKVQQLIDVNKLHSSV